MNKIMQAKPDVKKIVISAVDGGICRMLSYLPDDKPEGAFLFMSILHTTPVGYLSLPKWEDADMQTSRCITGAYRSGLPGG